MVTRIVTFQTIFLQMFLDVSFVNSNITRRRTGFEDVYGGVNYWSAYSPQAIYYIVTEGDLWLRWR